jgi:hypothetical protein
VVLESAHGTTWKRKHITPIENEKGEIITAKIIVYAEDSEEYYSFITPQAYYSLKNDWMDFRASYGEKITGEAWVMRDTWQTTNIKYGAKLGLATHPKKLKSSGLKRLIEHALWEQGLREPLTEGEKRHEWKAAHGLRKYCKSKAEQVMKPINVFLILDHDSGISESYYRPTFQEVLEDYLKAVPLLTLGANNYNLEKQQAENNHQEEEIQFLKQQVNGLMAMFRSALKGDIALAPDAKDLANYMKYDEKGNAVLRSDE